MRRVQSAAEEIQGGGEPETLVDAREALDIALSELDREVGLLIKATSQEVARARRREREAVQADARVNALRRPRRPGSSGA